MHEWGVMTYIRRPRFWPPSDFPFLRDYVACHSCVWYYDTLGWRVGGAAIVILGRSK
jgi:hypothetical protein